ncbi:MAG: class I SAM-dependent methyltransferase [Elusimicrobia bacterium]|nr:class I SAM-dependent methyltransferase [Elusimicrobiota bacterium]
MEPTTPSKHELRFSFGKNWRDYLRSLNTHKIEQAENSLRAMLRVRNLEGKTFLDAGSGSGLFSLAARRLGAKVTSFDYDAVSVECTESLKQAYCKNDAYWTVLRGDVLDAQWLASLGRFDVVYSWGVLHHTGDMRRALDNARSAVKDGGQLFIALYNDQGVQSSFWKAVKYSYNRLPASVRGALILPALARIWGPTLVKDTLKLSPLRTWNSYSMERGMSPWHDVLDWVGGYPFEVAAVDDVIRLMDGKGFALSNLKTVFGGHGCNEYVFHRTTGR